MALKRAKRLQENWFVCTSETKGSSPFYFKNFWAFVSIQNGLKLLSMSHVYTTVAYISPGPWHLPVAGADCLCATLEQAFLCLSVFSPLLFSLIPIAVMWPTLVAVVLLGKCVNKTLHFTLQVWKLKHNVRVYETSMHFNEVRLMDGLLVTLLILNSISYYGYLYSWNTWKYWRMTDYYHPPQIDFSL